MKRMTIQHFQSTRPYRASHRMKNSALLLYAQVQTDWVDTIVGLVFFTALAIIIAFFCKCCCFKKREEPVSAV
jgi:hypothetical protein